MNGPSLPAPDAALPQRPSSGRRPPQPPTAGRVQQPPQEKPFSVVVIEDWHALAQHVAAWEALATATLEPNVFYEPWMLLPALEAFAAGQDLCFVLLFAPDPQHPQGPPLLCGFFPLERQPRYKGLPVRRYRLWQHLHCFLCCPLVRASHAAACLSAFFDWLASDTRGAALMEFNFVPGDGPFHQLLVDHHAARGCATFVAEAYTRALFRPVETSDAYLAQALCARSRKKLRRQRKQLAALGRLETTWPEAGGEGGPWIEAFLQLEAAGWKGRAGTAILLHEGERNYYRAFLAEAFRRGRVLMPGLYLNDSPVALAVNLRAGAGSFALKMAFNETYARFSPGVLLEVEHIRHQHTARPVAWMDSCAMPDDPMNNRLWIDRRVIQTVLVPTGRRGGEMLVSLLPALRWLVRKLLRRRRPTRP